MFSIKKNTSVHFLLIGTCSLLRRLSDGDVVDCRAVRRANTSKKNTKMIVGKSHCEDTRHGEWLDKLQTINNFPLRFGCCWQRKSSLKFFLCWVMELFQEQKLTSLLFALFPVGAILDDFWLFWLWSSLLSAQQQKISHIFLSFNVQDEEQRPNKINRVHEKFNEIFLLTMHKTFMFLFSVERLSSCFHNCKLTTYSLDMWDRTESFFER